MSSILSVATMSRRAVPSCGHSIVKQATPTDFTPLTSAPYKKSTCMSMRRAGVAALSPLVGMETIVHSQENYREFTVVDLTFFFSCVFLCWQTSRVTEKDGKKTSQSGGSLNRGKNKDGTPDEDRPGQVCVCVCVCVFCVHACVRTCGRASERTPMHVYVCVVAISLKKHLSPPKFYACRWIGAVPSIRYQGRLYWEQKQEARKKSTS